MKILTDPRSRGLTCLSAARNLVELNDTSNRDWIAKLFGKAIFIKFSNPTTAEAILAAHIRHRNAVANGDEKPIGYRRVFSRGDFLPILVWLNDQRIAPALAKLAAAEGDLRERLMFASTAFELGEPRPLESIARALEAGTLKMRPLPSPEDTRWSEEDDEMGELGEVISVLSVFENPHIDRALWALVNTKHPYHRVTVALLIRHGSALRGRDELFRHPYWIGIARQSLEDTTPTGRTWKFENGRCSCSTRWTIFMLGTPDELSNPQLRRDQAVERVCDLFAAKICGSCVGSPAFHPLRVDCQEQLTEIITTVGRFDQRYRPLQWRETRHFGANSWRGYHFLPIIKPLNRAATFADVATGDAVFHLDGKGKVADVALPAWVNLKDHSRGLVVQAEIGADGKTIYGVIFRQGMRAVPAAEVENVEPVVKK